MLGNPWIEVCEYFISHFYFLKPVASVRFHSLTPVFELIVFLSRIPQATSCSALEMPTSSEILQVILEYIYTDESPTTKGRVPSFISAFWVGLDHWKERLICELVLPFLPSQSLWMWSLFATCWLLLTSCSSHGWRRCARSSSQRTVCSLSYLLLAPFMWA